MSKVNNDSPKWYDPERDIHPVEQTGWIDLKAANVNSAIPVIDGLEDERFNGIDDPKSIGARPSDEFEFMQANKAIVGYKVPSSTSSASDSAE